MATKREVIRDARNIIVDWAKLAADMCAALESIDSESIEEGDYIEEGEFTIFRDYDTDELTVSFYLGSVLHLSPSGKYYTPWANSNVNACPRCNGSGHTSKTHPCHTCQGNGHRFVSELAALRKETEEQTAQFLDREYPDCNRAMGMFDCLTCNGSGSVPNTCTWCEGTGSREAYLDSLFWDTLEDTASEHGLYLFSGDGDPLDTYIGMSE